MKSQRAFAKWFKQAAGHEPYPFQTRFACESPLPQLVDVPTGLGKTAMAVLGMAVLGPTVLRHRKRA